MRTLALFITSITIALLITSCANKAQNPTQVASNFIQRQTIVAITNETYPAKNPLQVALYRNDQSPHVPYRIIGVATVSKFNLFGTERQNVTLNTMMKKLAASIGGDGLINVKTDEDAMQARVIAFQKILI